MEIELKNITIRELVEGYQNNKEDGIVGYGGKLDIRPPYQREFIYNDKQRDAVIDTVIKNFPLNVMYWVVRKDGAFEVMDGQQRTLSICQYVAGVFSFNGKYFHNLQDDEKEKIYNYKLMVYWCEGTDSEKLQWFETINIAGEKLTNQELRNAVYSGSWVTEAKRYFSKTGCVAYGLASDYVAGTPNRQDYLETAIKWIISGTDDSIEKYMGSNQHNQNANELWLHFQNVINWIKVTFPKRRKEMKGLDWGLLYSQFKDKKFDTEVLENRIAKLMMDEDVTKKKGIYPYVLDGDEKHLSIRVFSESQKREAYERQKGICVICEKHFELERMEADHIDPWSKGGKTVSENCKMLCVRCNRRKSDI